MGSRRGDGQDAILSYEADGDCFWWKFEVG